MNGVRNSKISVDFDLSQGITLSGIKDVATGRRYLSTPSMLFEFAVNKELAVQSNRLIIQPGAISNSPDASSMTVTATQGMVTFYLVVTLVSDSSVATLALSVTNTRNDSIFLRVVLPKIRGISISPGNPADMMGAIPQEAGSVMPLSAGTTLGMPFKVDVGLPFACNNMEVASIFDQSQGGGLFFCDLDGDPNNGVAPLQFNLSAAEVVAFWIGTIAPNTTTQLPRLGIGVHSTGDWHQAVDFYTSVHRPSWIFPNTPAWFRDAGAIYCPTTFGAGGIYLTLLSRSLAEGAVWITWEDGDGAWRDGKDPDKLPLAVSPAGFAPPGAFLLAANQNADQINLFAAGNDGAISTTWEVGGGPWTNNRNGLTPARITPPNLATPGQPLTCGQQGDDQLDVFFVDNEGAVTVTWQRGTSVWTDGTDGRPGPVRITSPGFAPPGAHLATARQNDSQLDLFVINNDGAIWVLWVDGFGAWAQTPITPRQIFPAGAPLVAAWQNKTQLNVFAVSNFGTILTIFEDNDSAWTAKPLAISPEGFAPACAHLASAKQSDAQLDIFVVRADGAIWVTWEDGDGAWTDGGDGRLPKPISASGLAPGGAPLAVARQGSDQWNVFVIGNDGAVWVTWEKGDGAWTDAPLEKPGSAQPVTPPGLAPPSSGVAAIAQGESQVNAFCVGNGNLRSFLDLPNLLNLDARNLGTNILYLTDYWEGTDQGGDPPYFNKGDYLPRLDLGGNEAFIQGIAAVHQAGGRVILYFEPFIIYKYSVIAQRNGEAWVGRDANGIEDNTYPDNYTMVAPFPDWQNYVVSIVERLVGYGADGIFLDSYAWQMNRPLQCNGDTPGKYTYTAHQYAAGVLDLTRKVRTAIQSINPDAIVMGETTAGPIALRWDGGLNADFGFDSSWANNLERLTASPVRYGIPEVRMFSNGLDLNGLQQMYAAGHGLALCNYWPTSFIYNFAPHIKKLVDVRTTYKDALIHGAQINQPSTGNPQVVAYHYQGTTYRIVTIVTIGSMNAIANIDLKPSDPGGYWQDLLTPDKFFPVGGILQNVPLSLDEGGIRVLLNIQRRFPY